MKISFERSGGFAGIPIVMNIDVDNLPDEDAKTLRKQVSAADFFNITESNSSKTMPDEFQYVITIEDDNHKRTIKTSDSSAPESLRPLISNLSSMALAQRRSS